MPKKYFQRTLCVLFSVLFFILSSCPVPTVFSAEAEEPVRYCYTNDYIKFRSAPKIQSGNELISSSFTFSRQQVLPVYGEAQGSSYNGSTTWYRVSYTYRPHGKEYFGYVHSSLVTLCEKFDPDTKEFSEFPASYRPYLAALKAAHPNWTFLPLDTQKDWSAAVAAQSAVTLEKGTLTSPSFISKNDSEIYRSTAVVGGLSASSTLLDGGTMYCAGAATVAYFMDPRNALDEVNVFMFCAQAYDEAVHTLEGVENILEGSYMEGLVTPNADGVEVSYAQAFLDAGIQSGISPYYLLFSSFAENNKTEGTNLSRGNLDGGVCRKISCTDEDHRGYYNFYGIGATPGTSPQHNGLLYAIEQGWNTAYKAIVGGATFLGDSYITKGQQTPYLKKFNVNPASPVGIWHQWMQNLAHPRTEAVQIFRSMKEEGMLDDAQVFLIPVYSNMPESACKLPTTETYVPDSPSGGESGGDASSSKPTFSSNYTLDYTGYVYGIAPGTSEATLRKNFTLGADTTLSVSSSAVGTGTMIRILYRGEAVYTFYAVVRGDLSGNGKIEALDLLYLRDYLLGKKSLSAAYLKAADVDVSGDVKSLDLLKLRDANLGLYTISQKG